MVDRLPVSHNDCALLGVVGGVSRPTEAEVALAEPDRRVQLLAYVTYPTVKNPLQIHSHLCPREVARRT